MLASLFIIYFLLFYSIFYVFRFIEISSALEFPGVCYLFALGVWNLRTGNLLLISWEQKFLNSLQLLLSSTVCLVSVPPPYLQHAMFNFACAT